MILGALLDAGLSLDDLRGALVSLDVDGYSLKAQRAQRGGLDGTHLVVELEERGRRTHTIQNFVDIVEASGLSNEVVRQSREVFLRIGEAEARVHGTATGETHLHELGTLDTLVDVVGSVAGLEMLGVERVYCSAFPSGSGVVRSEHGLLPVPAPATAVLFQMANAPVAAPPNNAHNTGEMVTPTGAAVLTTLAIFEHPQLSVARIGYGLGTRDSQQYPNALALWLGSEQPSGYSTGVKLIETNIDDMSGELLGYVQERLFEIGARDVWFTPIQMKKNRPATMLSIIVSADKEAEAVELVMRETSTLGVRVRPLERIEAEREVVRIETSVGSAAVKLKRLNGRVVSVSPEYEDARLRARERDLPLQEVFSRIQREAESQIMER
ncbi:Putative nickel insertion protein [Geodia barretti]|uniref:Nickel insertion protein n=1 Tax=Geodia barretti TaxID=519541 RepID=A0AA35R0D6_GEOBA|nr:Putative nickel insertion protein [Geodia barretti]